MPVWTVLLEDISLFSINSASFPLHNTGIATLCIMLNVVEQNN